MDHSLPIMTGSGEVNCGREGTAPPHINCERCSMYFPSRPDLGMTAVEEGVQAWHGTGSRASLLWTPKACLFLSMPVVEKGV